jgi:hypothetical protein
LAVGSHAAGGLQIAEPKCLVLDIIQICKFRYGVRNIFIEYLSLRLVSIGIAKQIIGTRCVNIGILFTNFFL